MATKKRLTPAKRPVGAPPGREKLTSAKRREAFIEAYLGPCALNGAAAARAAGYAEGSAAVEASRLLKEPEIAARIDAELKERASKSAVSLASITAFLIEVTEGRTLATVGLHEGVPVMGEPKHSDRLKASEMLARLHGLDRQQVDVTVTPASSELLQRAADAARQKEALEAQLRERGSE